MTSSPTDWNGVAFAKLTRVLGEDAGARLMREILADLELPTLTSAADLHRFATALSSKGGFAAAVGGLLSLHAAMYEQARTETPP